MKTTDWGLTDEERKMFSILGVILLIVAFVIVIWILSCNERVLKENPKVGPITSQEINHGAEVKKDEEIIEANSASKTPVMLLSDKKENNTIDDSTWSLPDELVTNAVENEKIVIDRDIRLSDGTTRRASVIVRKLEDNTYNIVDITNNRFVATEGIYKYYYTYNGITKEEVLVVNDQLKNIDIRAIDNDLVYYDNIEFSEQEFYDILDNSLEPTIYINNDIYQINITRTNEMNKVVLLLNLYENINYIYTTTLGITIGSSYEAMWHENYSSGLVRLLVDFDKINPDEIMYLKLNYNGMNKIVKVKFNVQVDMRQHDVGDEKVDDNIYDDKILNQYENLYFEEEKRGREEESSLNKEDKVMGKFLENKVAYKKWQQFGSHNRPILYSNKVTSTRP